MANYKVFDPQTVLALAKKHRATFMALSEIEKILLQRFAGMEEPILALILAVAAGEPLLFVGPPGTAKSRLIRVFCELIGLIDLADLSNAHNGREDGYFEYLLTPFTEPGELFGYFAITERDGETTLTRHEVGMMQRAKVVYLDEVFNGSSAILNSILAFINERVFHDRGERKPVNMQVLFGATNDIPQTNELRAIYDRFLLRCHVDNIQPDPKQVKILLEKGWTETYSAQGKRPFVNLLDQLKNFRKDMVQQTTQGKLSVQSDARFLGKLTQHISHIRRTDLSEMSNRRVIKMLNIMLIHAIYTAVRDNRLQLGVALSDEQLSLLRFAQDRRDELAEQALRYNTETVA